MDAVHVLELLVVERGRAGADALEREPLDELVHGHDLGLVVVAPAEQGEVVDERLGEVALVAELLDPDGAVTLGELLPVGSEDARDVAVARHVRAEHLEDADLLRRVGDVVVAPDDVRDAVQPVLDGRGEVVGRPTIRANGDEVVELYVRVLDPPADEILPAGDAVVGHADADGALVLVGRVLGDEALRLLLAALHAVELKRDVVVPVQAEPAERLEDLLGGLGDLAARVRVLDPEVERAALVAREEPVEQRRPNTPDVQQAGGARGEADSDRHLGRLSR